MTVYFDQFHKCILITEVENCGKSINLRTGLGAYRHHSEHTAIIFIFSQLHHWGCVLEVKVKNWKFFFLPFSFCFNLHANFHGFLIQKKLCLEQSRSFMNLKDYIYIQYLLKCKFKYMCSRYQNISNIKHSISMATQSTGTGNTFSFLGIHTSKICSQITVFYYTFADRLVLSRFNDL